MIESILLLEWDKIDHVDVANGNGVIKNSNGSSNTKVKKQQLNFVNSKIKIIYPQDNIVLNNKSTIKRIINEHIDEIEKIDSDKDVNLDLNNIKLDKNYFKVQMLFDYAIFSCFLPSNKIICLVFEKEDNPLDHFKDFWESLEFFVYSDLKAFHNSSDLDIETKIISIFMDIRNICHILMDDSTFFINKEELLDKVIEGYQNKIIKIFLYGIDNSGKSSLIRFLKTGRYDHNYFLPTKKILVHKINIKERKLKIIAWEMPGQKAFRRIWLRGVQDSNILIFLLDAVDNERFIEAKRAFWSIITRYEVKKVPVLFIANKIDLIDDSNSELGKIESYFSLQELEDRKWTIKFMSLATKQGVSDVLDWITETISNKQLDSIEEELDFE